MEMLSYLGTSLAVQWLRLCISTAGGLGSNSGQGTKILPVARPKKERKVHEWNRNENKTYQYHCLISGSYLT